MSYWRLILKGINGSLILFFLCFMAVISVEAQKSRAYKLGSLDFSQATQTYSVPVNNRSVTGTPLSVAGITYKHGIGLHSNSRFFIKLDGKAERFEALLGIDDHKPDVSNAETTVLVDGTGICHVKVKGKRQFLGVIGNSGKLEKGSARVTFYGDGKVLLLSKVIRGGEKATPISVDLKGVKILKVEVDKADNGYLGDHVNFCNAIIRSSKRPGLTDSEFSNEDIAIAGAVKTYYEELPAYKAVGAPQTDWLIDDSHYKAKVMKGVRADELIFTNGLTSRVFKISPNLTTLDVVDHVNNRSLIRGVKPEAQIKINGQWYDVGGAKGQKIYAYNKTEWYGQLVADPNAFSLVEISHWPIVKRNGWSNRRRSDKYAEWPPKGLELRMQYGHKDYPGTIINVHYNLYDKIPVFCKWITVVNNNGNAIQLNEYRSEILALTEYDASVNSAKNERKSQEIIFASDYVFGGSYDHEVQDKSIHYSADPQYNTIVNYSRESRLLMESYPELGPNVDVDNNAVFESHRTWELITDSYDRERRSLAHRRMYRTVAPWITENPSVMHIRSADEDVVQQAIDDCAEVGFDTGILTFGSGANIEDMSDENLTYLKKLADYSKSKGVEIGGYSLLASSWRGEKASIRQENGEPGGGKYGNAPCLHSEWGDRYFDNLKEFYKHTGFTLFENDGSYPGDRCHSTEHYHKGYEDSQWQNWKRITDYYKWNTANNIYNNIPDYYFLSGGHKCAMHYREANFSHPRKIHLVLARRDIFDGTWEKTPSMGWMHVPLTAYQGGGGTASYHPLNENIADYENVLWQNFLLGVQGHYRGFRLFDSPETEALVKKVISYYEVHWDILNSDIVHFRRPDGRQIDGMLHVNPKLEEKGFLVLFNPTTKDIVEDIKVPAYYTGLTDDVTVIDKNGKQSQHALTRDYKLLLKVSVPANGMSWFLLK